ncbi:MAG: phosphate signaling complex protein PhoU [Sphaerochaetaceae bacterium]|nr:phosphate signaling complex protein PhoU [Sphaerochaetaceae bacterium]MDC7246899.1 phosphate signaling complex protein PhoU [Sphaerochaetaceae bacterium]
MKEQNSLDDKMHFFQEMMLQMVTRVEEAVYQARSAFEEHDVILARKVIENDYFIDQLQEMIENDGVRLLVSEAPYGHYMRHIIAGIKMVSNLERMGDHAAHLAKMATADKSEAEQPYIKKISDMALIGATMIRKAVEAFVDVESEKAIEVAQIDDQMDAARDEINSMLFKATASDPAQMERLLNLFYVAKEMERLGDHVTTICRWIVYMEKGERPHLNNPHSKNH